MKILKNIIVPTGNILVVEGEKGLLECLSLGDYGKDINIKCDKLGLTRIPSPVRHTKLLPLEEKWVITISTQYGCRVGLTNSTLFSKKIYNGCRFCDVPKVKFQGNATRNDLLNQVYTAMSLHPEIKFTKRLNIHFARMGEPTYNNEVLEFTKWMAQFFKPQYHIHPVVSTMMPCNNHKLKNFLTQWMWIKNELLKGEAGLQLSINSTDDNERHWMFNRNELSLEEISEVMKGITPKGRKITLNFAIANYTIDESILQKYFNPAYYICKLTPMHKTMTALENGIKTPGDYTEYYPYQETEEKLKSVGYDVLVFIASKEEDESMITCGNAVLANKVEYPIPHYEIKGI